MKENDKPVVIGCYIGKYLGGGVESVMMNYYRNIDKSKVQFDFICDSDSTNIPYEEIESMGGRVILVPPYQSLFEFQKEFAEICRKNNYKILHSNVNALSVFPLRAAKKAGVPVRIAHSHSTSNKKEWKKTLIKNILPAIPTMVKINNGGNAHAAMVSQRKMLNIRFNLIVFVICSIIVEYSAA